MTEAVSAAKRAGRFPTAKRRVLVVVLLAGALALVASSDELHGWFIELLSAAEPTIRGRPVLGVTVFVLFAALSAMLAFVSSALIVPVGVYVWGKATSLLLLWVGWILGGVCAYTLSRYLGRPIMKALSSGKALERYEDRISHRAPFSLVLLFQLAMPSEVPGYLLGFMRYHFWKYLGALALAELPYALATIYLGASFIEQRKYVLIGVGAAVAAFSGWALYTLHRRIVDKGSGSVSAQ
ncbi:MAG: VTT domain-containing protein [Acidobacteria bacterium]|nr:VTT domain-containing protein [Acidobacteriota bacterium]